jgi:Uma2 family endonuclease
MVDPAHRDGRGPFRAEHLHDGDRYELSRGHALYCLPGGGDHAYTHFVLPRLLGSDPDVQEGGVEAGYQLADDTLRAPDVSVGNVPQRPGWVQGAPPLAVEIASAGQDEADLALKTRELLEHGGRFVWIVRLTGPRRVEVHEPGREPRTLVPGEVLEAPGVLRNPIPVEALFDPEVADRVQLRNLLGRYGYESLEAVRAEGHAEGHAEGRVDKARELARRLIHARFGVLNPEFEARIQVATESELDALASRVLTAATLEDLLKG